MKHLLDDEFDYDSPKVPRKLKSKPSSDASLKREKKATQREIFDNSTKIVKKDFQCEHCPLSFKEEQELFDHEEVHFKTEEVYDCPLCNMVFATKSMLLCHRRITHNDRSNSKSSRFKCDECGKTFLQKSGLRTHFTIHTGEKPFQCEICCLKFRLNSSLQRHICREHFTSKPFKCDKCGKDFGHNSDLMHHVRSVHATERLFVCQICDEKFTTNVVLMRHVNIHFELKLNECKVCGTKFSHSGSLYNHMKIHSNERAYQCPTCGKSYKLKSHLRNHSCSVNSKQRRRYHSTYKYFSNTELIELDCEDTSQNE